MDNLKSALRFPHPPPPLPPRPPPPPPPPPRLVSRFSAETLVAKSPPGPSTLHRFFSPSTSVTTASPRSPSLVVSATPTRPKHSPSASESYIDRPSPRLYDPEVCPWSRASLGVDRAEVLRTPTLANGREWAREWSGATAGGAIGLGKDRLAGAAREVIDLIARKRHGRKESQDGANSDRASSASRRPSASKTNPAASPPRSRPRAPAADSTRPSLEQYGGRQHVAGYKLVDLPPRSDSRNAIANAVVLSAPTRNPPEPLGADSSVPQARPPKPTLRPNSPPSISIPPLKPNPRPLVPPLPSIRAVEATPFDALVLSLPDHAECDPRKVLVEINVGGASHTTTMETLVRDQRGGKLGQFVASSLANVPRKRGPRPDGSQNSASVDRLEIPRFANEDDDDVRDSGSSIGINPSHFEVSPQPSPFPFMRFSSGDDDENDCSSPIDPLAPQLFLPIPSFAPPPPPLRLELDPLPATRRVNLVASPRFDLKHLSVHPTISSNASPPLASPSQSTVSPRRVSTVPSLSPRSWSYHDLPASPNEIAARQALAKRLHLSTGSLGKLHGVESGGETLDAGSSLEPFFQVLCDQAYEAVPSSWPERSAWSNPGEAGDEIPLDAGYSTPEEDRSRSTIIGIPRGGSVKRAKRTLVRPPAVPSLTIEADSDMDMTLSSASMSSSAKGERPPSLTQSDSTALTESEYPASEPPPVDVDPGVSPLVVFLDRTDVALPSGLGTTYQAVLSFVRDRILLPGFLAPLDPTTTLSILSVQPALAFGPLAALSLVQCEAEWLGIDELARACAVERARWVDALRRVAEVEQQRREESTSERERERERERRRAAVGFGEARRKRMKERELEGWI
ncbi:hypothetical protein JCM11491_000057 [Sporobolomyces phaffii]